MTQKISFTSGQIGGTFCNAVAKSTAEPRNSNDLQMANSTPSACFFIRSTRTSQERPERHSMVACSGKGSALCCVPFVAVFEPVTRYRQSLERKAVVSTNSQMELLAMLFKFLLLGEKRLTVRTYAKTEAEARQRLNLSKTNAICVARYRTTGGIYGI